MTLFVVMWPTFFLRNLQLQFSLDFPPPSDMAWYDLNHKLLSQALTHWPTHP